jgi:hypothetical protein
MVKHFRLRRELLVPPPPPPWAIEGLGCPDRNVNGEDPGVDDASEKIAPRSRVGGMTRDQQEISVPRAATARNLAGVGGGAILFPP